MGCNGCTQQVNGLPEGCHDNGTCNSDGGNKLTVYNWLSDMKLPTDQEAFDVVEVRFKNSRKGFYRNKTNLKLNHGDAVAVEASTGHDIGVVSIVGELVKLQLKEKGVENDNELFEVYRKATQKDLDIWKEARAREWDTMMTSRKIAGELGLKMKISDIEYQGDNSKAIFYYTAEDRVDFRVLIKELASSFSIRRVEMKQIGLRQEAARIGGIGSCGRELCCTTWLTDFRSVTTTAARYQQLSLNPQKLAGQCGKLKCCLNFELDSYLDALKDFPDTDVLLKTDKGDAFFQKMDIFKGLVWYSYKDEPLNWLAIPLDIVKKVIDLNKKGEKIHAIDEYHVDNSKKVKQEDFHKVVGQDDLNRFDKKPNNKNSRNNKPRKRIRKVVDKISAPDVNKNDDVNKNVNEKVLVNKNVNPKQKPNPNKKPNQKPTRKKQVVKQTDNKENKPKVDNNQPKKLGTNPDVKVVKKPSNKLRFNKNKKPRPPHKAGNKPPEKKNNSTKNNSNDAT
ncbi:MAG: hypothetical protein KAG96_01985 [Ichthyobacteriaceae bacterium]|nr:hypothetical protein [Ichthyobacteriaceae bacterium]